MGRFIKTPFGILLTANLVGFIAFHLLTALCGESAAAFVGVEAVSPWPWTLASYMFCQISGWDLLFNMLWLWLFCRIALEFSTDRDVILCYLAGGLAGGIVFLLLSLTGLCGGMLFGASAATLSLITYSAVRVPALKLNLMFFGSVSVRTIAIISVALSLIAFALSNPGGGCAHLGGALGGIGYALLRRSQLKFRIVKPAEKKTLDELLDKVRRSGYASLTKSERQQLMDYSKRL